MNFKDEILDSITDSMDMNLSILRESSWDSRPPAGQRSWALGTASGLPGEGRGWSPWLEGGGRTEISPGPREQGAGLGTRASSREIAGVTEGFSRKWDYGRVVRETWH